MLFRLLQLSLGLLLLVGCEPEPRPELVSFVFVVPVTITPGADTVARGDTLWLSVDFSDSLLDLRSNRRYRVTKQNLELTASIGFRKLLGPNQPPGSFAQGFTVVPQVGQVTAGGATFRRFEPVYDGQRYRARIGIIPRFTGVYALNMLNAVEGNKPMPFLTLAPDADGKSRRALFDGLYYVINDGHTHFALQQQHSQVTSMLPSGSTEANIYYEQKGTFTFVVR